MVLSIVQHFLFDVSFLHAPNGMKQIAWPDYLWGK